MRVISGARRSGGQLRRGGLDIEGWEKSDGQKSRGGTHLTVRECKIKKNETRVGTY